MARVVARRPKLRAGLGLSPAEELEARAFAYRDRYGLARYLDEHASLFPSEAEREAAAEAIAASDAEHPADYWDAMRVYFLPADERHARMARCQQYRSRRAA